MTYPATIVLLIAQATGGDPSSGNGLPTAPPARPGTLPTFDILIWLSVLLVGVIVGYLIAMYFRARVNATPESGPKATFTLAELRQLHAAGRLSDDEFAKARDRVLRMNGYVTPAEEPADGAAESPADTAPPTADHAHDDLGPELLADPRDPRHPDSAPPANPGEIGPERADDDSHNADEGESDRRID